VLYETGSFDSSCRCRHRHRNHVRVRSQTRIVRLRCCDRVILALFVVTSPAREGSDSRFSGPAQRKYVAPIFLYPLHIITGLRIHTDHITFVHKERCGDLCPASIVTTLLPPGRYSLSAGGASTTLNSILTGISIVITFSSKIIVCTRVFGLRKRPDLLPRPRRAQNDPSDYSRCETILSLALVDEDRVLSLDLRLFERIARLKVAVQKLAGDEIADARLHDSLALLHAQKCVSSTSYGEPSIMNKTPLVKSVYASAISVL